MSSSGGSISSYIGGKFAATVIVAAAATAVFVIPAVTGNGGGGGTTANVWVTDGTCDTTPARQSTPATFANTPAGSRACTFDQAWDVLLAGETGRIEAGAYGSQVINGNKASATYLIGDGDGDDVTIGTSTYQDGANCANAWSSVCADGNFLVLENVTSLVNDPGPAGGLSVSGTNVTVRDFHARGAVASNTPADTEGYFWASSIGVYATNFVWDRGSLGRTDTPETAHCYHSAVEPFWFQSGGDTATITGVDIGRYASQVASATEPRSPAVGGGFCDVEESGEYNPHLETIRFEDSDNVTFRGNTFHGPSNVGSGHVFTTSDPDGVKFIGNVFEDRGDLGAWNQVGGTPNDWTWAYNTFLDDGGRSGTIGSETFVGNFGFSPGCGTTDLLNRYSGSGSCGTSTYFGATAFGLDANNRAQAGSPAIDTAETPGASDYCTDPAIVASVDIDDDVRPFNSICDAGADEYTG